ncbi:hypothetical protein CR513_52757, partial [Mucuna pruriens]
MKFSVGRRGGSVWANSRLTQCYYEDSLRVGSQPSRAKDSVVNSEHERPLPVENLKEIQIGPSTACKTKISTMLEKKEESCLTHFLMENRDVFAWTQDDRPGIDPNFMCHRLLIALGAKSITQRKWKQGKDKRRAAKEETSKLLAVGFIKEVMSFGMKNAGATYQCLMDKIFKDVIGTNVEVCVNDMVVKSTTTDEHCSALERSAETTIPIFDTLKRGGNFALMPGSEEAFLKLKALLATPLVLTRPTLGIPLLIYVSDDALSATMVQEKEGKQYLIYFTSKVLQGAKKSYQKIEKASLALVITLRKLHPYFQGYNIIVRTNLLIR